MRWNHLPEPGGLYAQHPRLLEEWQVLFQLEAKYDEEQRQLRQQEMQNKRAKS